MSLMKDAGLKISIDSMGSIFGTWSGSSGDRIDGRPVATGSHIDAVPRAGAYDGTLGVLGGIEAIRSLKESGFKPLKPLQVIMFTSEEPTRFGLSCISSRAMAGALDAQSLARLKDVNGTTFVEAAHGAGYALDFEDEKSIIASARQHAFSAFVELHIEQGPELEADRIDIGAVTAIAAPSALQVRFSGSGGHAGALLMKYRNDASLAASELAIELEKAVLSTQSHDTVGTVGKWIIEPNAINSVPREAYLEIDIRDIDKARRDYVLDRIRNATETIAHKRKLQYTFEVLNTDPPAQADKAIVEAIQEGAKRFGLSSKSMVSRAYHDSLFMAQLTRMGMIFIPCEGGKSHRPDEFASSDDIANGIKVLAYTMAKLAGGESHQHSEL